MIPYAPETRSASGRECCRARYTALCRCHCPLRRTFDALRPRLMSLAGWVVLGGGSEVAQKFKRQAEGAIRQRFPPVKTPIRDGRIYEFPRMVNKLENPQSAEFSIQEFVFAYLFGSRRYAKTPTGRLTAPVLRCFSFPESIEYKRLAWASRSRQGPGW